MRIATILAALSCLSSFFAVHGQMAGMYQVSCSDVEIVANPDKTGLPWQIEMDLEFENKIDPMLVFDYDLEEQQNFLNIEKHAFVVIDGQRLLPAKPLKGPLALPGGFVIKHEGDRIKGKLAFPCPIQDPKSIEFWYFHEDYGAVKVTVKGSMEQIDPDPKTIQQNGAVVFSVLNHGTWNHSNGIQPKNGMEYYFVELAGKSVWAREVPAYVLNPEAAGNATVTVFYPFEYQQSNIVLNVLVDDEFAYPYEAESGHFSQPLTFVPERWTRATLVFEIPKTRSSLDICAQFMKFRLGGGGFQEFETITAPLVTGKPDTAKGGNEIQLIDSDEANQMQVSMRLVSPFGALSIDAQQYATVLVTFESKGQTSGVMEARHRFSMQAQTSCKPIWDASLNPYLIPEKLFLKADEKRSFVLLFDRKQLGSSHLATLHYGGIANNYAIAVDFEQQQLAQRSAGTIASSKSPPPQKQTKNPSNESASDGSKHPSKTLKKPPLVTVNPVEIATPGNYFSEVKFRVENEFKSIQSDTAATLTIEDPKSKDPIDLEKQLTIADQLDPKTSNRVFRIHFSEQDSERLWDIIQTSPDPKGILRMKLANMENTIIYRTEGNGYAAMTDLSPVPGDYLLTVSGFIKKAFPYRLKIIECGTPIPGYEREPNDHATSKSLAVIETINPDGPELLGYFDAQQGDHFAINVTDRNQLYTVSAAGETARILSYVNPAGSALRRVYRFKENAPALVDMRLPLGINHFHVEGKPGDYAINVQLSNTPTEYFEWEPNDLKSHAQVMTFGKSYCGRLLDNQDLDFYRLVIRQPMHYRILHAAGANAQTHLKLSGKGIQSRNFASDANGSIDESVWLIPGPYFIQVQAKSPSTDFYALQVEAVSPFPNDASEILLTCETDEPMEAAAYLEQYQQVRLQLNLKNKGTSDRELRFKTASSHLKIHADHHAIEAFQLKGGASRTIEIPWVIEPGISDDAQVQLYVAVETLDAQQLGHTSAKLHFSTDTIAPAVLHSIQTPQVEVAGGYNLNSLQLGATAVVEQANTYPSGKQPPIQGEIEYLMDDILANRSFSGYQATVRLAGDGSIPIVGTTLDLHGKKSLWESAKDFSIGISQNGRSFKTVFEGSLLPKTGDQVFLFDQPVKGQYAQIKLLNTHNGEAIEPHLGEWRMISQPGLPLSDSFETDLLQKKMGGHLIWEDKDAWVYGFQHGRAARISQLFWQNRSATQGKYGNPARIQIEVSENSPVGPWTQVADIDMSSAESGDLNITESIVDEPWARYVKFTWQLPKGCTQLKKPDFFRLFEKTPSENYLSLLGYWNGSTKNAYGEWQQSANVDDDANQPESIKRIQSTPKSPYLLSQAMWVNSVVWLEEDWQDWYQLPSLQAGQNYELKVQGSPFVKVQVDLSDANGKQVATEWIPSGHQERILSFTPQTPGPYFAHVFEPKRSIIYLWDVSGSMGSFIPSIEQAILKFSEGIRPEFEQVRLLPFDDPPRFLLNDWGNDAYTLQNTVRNYDAPDSSYAHLNLLTATQELNQQSGTRAAIVITDCESSRKVNDKLWQALKEVQPTIFTFQTSDQTSGYEIEQDDMQDWAAVGGGFYHNTRAVQELDEAFARVQASLRKPSTYRIQLHKPELKPGWIQVLDGREHPKETVSSENGVLLIADVSASMRDRLPNGESKASEAKKMIHKLVDETLPPEVYFGLRVFGHRGGENCKSELKIPMQKLDPNLVRNQLMHIRSSSLGNTALAEALSFAKADFDGLKGKKRIVVLTDGKETCYGNPGVEIANLTGEGLDITVNIVGYTLEDEDARADYLNWVTVTGGHYFDARNSEELGMALALASQPLEIPSFQILDEQGSIIAEGTVGAEPISVKSGTYTVKILSSANPMEKTVTVNENSVQVRYP